MVSGSESVEPSAPLVEPTPPRIRSYQIDILPNSLITLAKNASLRRVNEAYRGVAQPG
jgi:hypothetical protein